MKTFRNIILVLGLLLVVTSLVMYAIQLSRSDASQLIGKPFGIFVLLFLPGMILLAAFFMFGLQRPDLQYSTTTKIFMVIMLIASIILCVFSLWWLPASSDPISWWMLMALGVMEFVNYFSVLAVWNGRKLGLYGFAVASLVAFALNLLLGIGFLSALFLFSAALILFWLVWPVVWQMD